MAIKLDKETLDFKLSLKELKRGPFEIFLLEPIEGSDFKALRKVIGTDKDITLLNVDMEDDRNRITLCDHGIGNYCYEFSLSEFLELRKKPGSITGKCSEIGKPHHSYECTLFTEGV